MPMKCLLLIGAPTAREWAVEERIRPCGFGVIKDYRKKIERFWSKMEQVVASEIIPTLGCCAYVMDEVLFKCGSIFYCADLSTRSPPCVSQFVISFQNGNSTRDTAEDDDVKTYDTNCNTAPRIWHVAHQRFCRLRVQVHSIYQQHQKVYKYNFTIPD
jgi:hypothetical protein